MYVKTNQAGKIITISPKEIEDSIYIEGAEKLLSNKVSFKEWRVFGNKLFNISSTSLSINTTEYSILHYTDNTFCVPFILQWTDRWKCWILKKNDSFRFKFNIYWIESYKKQIINKIEIDSDNYENGYIVKVYAPKDAIFAGPNNVIVKDSQIAQDSDIILLFGSSKLHPTPLSQKEIVPLYGSKSAMKGFIEPIREGEKYDEVWSYFNLME